MDDLIRKRVAALLEERTVALAALTGQQTVRCPACGILLAARLLAWHAHSYDDDSHRVVEVMES